MKGRGAHIDETVLTGSGDTSLLSQAVWLVGRMRARFALLFATNLLAALVDMLSVSLVLPLFHFVAAENVQPTGFSAHVAQAFGAVGVSFTINSVLIVLISFVLVKFVLVSAAGLVQARLLMRLREAFRSSIIEALAEADYGYLLGQNQSRFLNLFASEVDTVIGSTKTLASILSTLIFVAAFLAASLLANWQLTVLALTMVGGVAVPFAFVIKRTKRLSVRLTSTNQSTQHLFTMLLSSLKYLKATNSARPLVKFAKRELGQRALLAFKLNTLKVLTGAATEPAIVIFISLFAFIAINQFGQSPSDILLPLLFLYRTGTRVMQVQRTAGGFSQGVGAVVALRRGFVDLAAASEPIGGADPGPLTSGITLRSVAYLHGPTRVLDQISMNIPAGMTVGLVGETGAGKTTLADVICGLLAPSAGSIAWNGRDYRELDRRRLRSQFGYVTQDPMVLNDTVLNNITLWKRDPDLPAVMAAARAADALDFIERIPSGFATVLGDRGQKLSGGQRQRIALARELYRDPEVLIVDEGTSALDSETEVLIQASLRALKGRKTLVLIAHRLSTLMHCDHIFVINKGLITAQGTWDELSAGGEEWFGRTLRLQSGRRG